MKSLAIQTLNTIALWLILMIGQMLGGVVAMAVTHANLAALPDDGPFRLMVALLIVNAAFAVAIAALAAHMHLAPWRKACALFVVLYGVETVLSLIEAAYFGSYLGLPASTLAMICITNAVKSILVCVAAGFLWRSVNDVAPWPSGLWWKFVVIVPVYILIYFGAGALIAWQGPALRAYYAQGLHIDRIQLSLLQVGRALIWAGLALVLVRTIRAPMCLTAGLTGLAFCVFMGISLIIPTSFMPWDVRKMHLMEVSSSNFVFGVIAALILMAGSSRQVKPVSIDRRP